MKCIVPICIALVAIVVCAPTYGAGELPFSELRDQYDQHVQPLVKRFCVDCHSTSLHEGELDLERFARLADVRTDPKVWVKVIEMLDNGEMPPKDSPQPTPAERRQLGEWVQAYLDAEALAGAGDPGPVVLRRLSNVEYNNTVRDLTGVDLQPAREFPVDGAAGEGFTNVGDALVVSPALLDKYLDAAKGIADHAVLLPDGVRFSAGATQADWTNEIVARIRGFYSHFTDPSGGTRVNLQGLQWDTNSGGRLPLEPYLAATITHREALTAGVLAGGATIDAIAAQEGLSPKYLRTLWDMLHAPAGSLLLDQVRARWTHATPADVPALAAFIREWQTPLTAFKSVGHFKPWQEPVNPLVEAQSFRLKLEPPADAADVALVLTAREGGSDDTNSLVAWRQPRLELPGRPPLYLRDVRPALRGLEQLRGKLADTARYLAAADAARGGTRPIDPRLLAEEHKLDPLLLAAWLDYLGVGDAAVLPADALFTERMNSSGNYDFIKGWGNGNTPLVVANSSDQEVRVPGIMKPGSVAVHPSPTEAGAIGWKCPLDCDVRITPRAAHAHPECGNGLTWSLEHRRPGERRVLSAGEFGMGQQATIEPIEALTLKQGELVSLLIGPRGDYTCDLTEVDLTIEELGGAGRTWILSRDVSGDILAGNPHIDILGNPPVWHFYHEPLSAETATASAGIPRGSLLDRWRNADTAAVRSELAQQVQQLLTGQPPAEAEHPDAVLHRQLHSLQGPLLGRIDFTQNAASADSAPAGSDEPYGLPPEMFGKHPTGGGDAADLIVRVPAVIAIRLPADLVAGREFVAAAMMDGASDPEAIAQFDAAVVAQPDGPLPDAGGLRPGLPIVARGDSPAAARVRESFDAFRAIFPAALCYAQVVPVDEVVTLALYHREDESLCRLMLDEAQQAQLDRLWDELWYISHEALKVEVGYVQFMEYVTQDGDVRLFEPLRTPIADRAAAFRQRLLDTEPAQLDWVIDFAAHAWRRSLDAGEQAGLRNLYAALRGQDLPHDTALRLTLARVLAAPSFLYKAEQPAAGPDAAPISDWELASRLSYFLWSSLPDEELRQLAAAGTLHEPAVLTAQARRMLADARARSLAEEFACQWIDVREFDAHGEKSEQTFPEFADLRGPMHEEAVRFFVDLFQRNGSVLDVLDADYTFVNEQLARHYGISDVTGPEWRRVDGLKARDRGGILGMAATLSKQSGASRTSPILRGNWLVETILGEKLPKPPRNVPQLPESELDTDGLSMRQITQRHTTVESCAKCHVRIDPFGFALEGFDAIGRRRTADLAGRPIDTSAELRDGTRFADIGGLRDYLLNQRRDDYVRQFCRKLLGYSLGRAVQLSDQPLLTEMQARMAADEFRFQTAIEMIVLSPQFRYIRGTGDSVTQRP